MASEEQRAAHWRANMRVTRILLAIWFVAAFVVVYFARELSAIYFFGWPLGFYLCAQGSILVFVLLVWFYAWKMARIDREYGAAGRVDGPGR